MVIGGGVAVAFVGHFVKISGTHRGTRGRHKTLGPLEVDLNIHVASVRLETSLFERARLGVHHVGVHALALDKGFA